MNKVLKSMLTAIAERHGLSYELMYEFIETAFIVAKVNQREPNVSESEYAQHDAFLKKLSDLERKARRYDLLIEAEKSGEGMAGK